MPSIRLLFKKIGKFQPCCSENFRFLTTDFSLFNVAARKVLGLFVNNVIRSNMAVSHFSELSFKKLVRFNLLFLTPSQNQNCSLQSLAILTVTFIGHSLDIVSAKVLGFLMRNVIRHSNGIPKVLDFLVRSLVRFKNLVRKVLAFIYSKSVQIEHSFWQTFRLVFTKFSLNQNCYLQSFEILT